MIRDLVEMEVELEGALAISLLSSVKFNESINERPPYSSNYQLARALGSIAKNLAAESSSEITRYAMEIFGGTGFLEEFPVAKFHRDSIVTSIWEGTSNIQALELLEVLTRKNGVDLVLDHLKTEAEGIKDEDKRTLIREYIDELKEETMRVINGGSPQFYSKELLRKYGEITASIYLSRLSESAKEEKGHFKSIARLYDLRHLEKRGPGHAEVLESSGTISWMGAGSTSH